MARDDLLQKGQERMRLTSRIEIKQPLQIW
jgi:hypothetical protein